MARAVAVVLLMTGCGFRIGLGSDGAIADDAIGDAAEIDAAEIDATPTTCLEKWQAHVVSLSTPVLLANIPIAGQQGDPFLTDNELVLFFVWDGDLFADYDIWAATRPSLAQPFGESTIKASISDLDLEDSKLAVDGDGLIGVIASQRAGTRGGWDLFEGRRSAGGNAVFETISSTNLGTINDTGSQLDPHLSADGLRIYYAAGNPQEIRVASRGTTNDPFGQPVPVGVGAAPGEGNADPTLSTDETVLIFTSDRPGSAALTNMWYSTRSSPSGTFGPPLAVPDINSSGYDGDAFLSPDSCRLYFASSRDASSDLYVAEVQ